MTEEFEDRDRLNLDFLLSMDRTGLVMWFMQATPDDIEYAMELMQQYSEELAIEQALNRTQWTEADRVINQFRLH